jgi:hypothetical protein
MSPIIKSRLNQHSPIARWLRFNVLEFPIRHLTAFGALRALGAGLPGSVFAFVSYQFPNPAGPIGSLYSLLKSFVDTNIWAFLLLLMASGIISFLLSMWKASAEKINTKYVDTIDGAHMLATAFALIAEVVTSKQARFGSYLERIHTTNAPSGPALTFNEITQPAKQIEELIRVARVAVKQLTGISDVRLVLANVDHLGKLSYAAYAPHDKGEPHAEMLEGDSLWTYVVRTKSSLNWPDVRKTALELSDLQVQNKLPPHSPTLKTLKGQKAPASILLLPIRSKFQNNQLSYVLSITSDIPNALNDQTCARIESTIWPPFFERLLLEHCLKEIKNYANRSSLSTTN